MTRDEQEPSAEAMRNFVVLRGRVSMPPDERRLPSGDILVSTRVVVERDAPRGRSGQSRSKLRIDAIDCVAWSARVQRVVRKWRPGDLVYVEGAIRRRFFRTDKGPLSKVEVELTTARLVAPAVASPKRVPSGVVVE